METSPLKQDILKLNNVNNVPSHDKENSSWIKPLLRQVMVCSGIWAIYFLHGMVLGAPTVLIQQIRKEANSTDAVSEEMASWLTSVAALAAIPWVYILPLTMHFFGRKWTFALECVTITIGTILFYLSKSVEQILTSEIILGISITHATTIAPALLAEYSSKRYRGLFLTIKSASGFWGIWMSNAIGTFYHWKTIGLMELLCCLSFLLIFWWPDSPYWLATKGRFDECKKAHRWLRGTSKEAERELEIMINTQEEYTRKKRNCNSWDRIKIFFYEVKQPEYYKPLLICLLLSSLMFCNGKFVCSLYIIDILKKITSSEATAYNMMLNLDGITVLSTYLGCAISRYCKRRLMLFTTTLVAVLFLLVLSLYLYLVKLNVVVGDNYISLSFLMIYTLSISTGPVILSYSIIGEIMPIRYKTSMLIIIGTFGSLMLAFFVKLAPMFFRLIGIYGAFLLYAILSILVSMLLYMYMPETKDKTLQEIQNYFNSSSKNMETKDLNIIDDDLHETEVLNKCAN